MANSIKNKLKDMKSSLKLPKKARDALVKAGLVLSGAAITGGTVAHVMSEDAKKQATELLQQMGVKSLEDVNAPDFVGMTPLMRAKSAMETKVLLSLGADPKAESKGGKNAIFYALDNRYDFVRKEREQDIELEHAFFTIKSKWNNGTENDVEVKGATMNTGAGIEIVEPTFAEPTRNIIKATLVTVEAEPVKRNTEEAISDDIKKVALLMKAGTPIKLSDLDLD